MTIQELFDKVNNSKTQAELLNKLITGKQDQVETLNNDIQKNIDSLGKLENMLLACKLILEEITIKSKTKLEVFITQALRQIFTDRDYAIELEIKEDVKRPSITILLEENGVKQDVKDSVGGGIITVLGFLFQIYYIEVYGLNKIMFIDEGLKEVSKVDLEKSNDDYLNNLLHFLKQLHETMGYKFVIVTHDDSVRLIADRVYRVKQGEVQELESNNSPIGKE